MHNTKKYNFKKKHLAIVITALLSTNIYAEELVQKEEINKSNLEVISVTAQKRSQNLQQVPIAVTAISGESLSEGVIKDVFDLSSSVPAFRVSQSQSATQSAFSIRGVGTSSQNFGLESSVGLYSDGVYRSRQTSMINNYVDIESVEILRGPQGTLFGKNTASGALSIRTRAPEHDGSLGFVEATIGNYGLQNYSGALNVTAVEDVLSFRATGFTSQRDGVVDDVFLGNNTINDRDRWGGRLQALYTPTDDLSVRVIADYAKIDEICCGTSTLYNNFTASGDSSKHGSDALLSSDAFGATIFNAADYANRKTALSFLPVSQVEDQGISAEINYDINDALTFVSVSAYREYNSLDFNDVDFTNADLLSKSNAADQTSFSQEFRLDYTTDDMAVILGAYYYTQQLDVNSTLKAHSQFDQYVRSDLGAINGLLAGIDQVSGLSGGFIAPSGAPTVTDSEFYNASEQDSQSYAIFGQVDYKIRDNLTLTAGLRYTDEDKDLVSVFTENYNQPTFFSSTDEFGPAAGAAGAGLGAIVAGLTGAGPGPGSPDFTQAQLDIAPFQAAGWATNALSSSFASRDNITDTLEDDQVTGTIKLAYQADDETLLYTSFGTGYKSGGLNTDRVRIGVNPVFDAETSQAFEVGLKKDFPEQDIRVNLAAHYTTVKDFQTITYEGSSFSLLNAGDYEIYGLELESTWLPTDTTVVNLSASYTDATYDSFDNGTCWNTTPWHTGEQDPNLNPNGQSCNRAGQTPAEHSKTKASLQVQQYFTVSDNIESYIQVDYNFLSSIHSTVDPLSKRGSLGLFNARVYFTFDEYDLDVILWGRNILAKDYRSSISLPGTLQSGKLYEFSTEPATFGLTATKRF